MDLFKSKGKDFLFIHIPKTGGTSFINSLNIAAHRKHNTFRESILYSGHDIGSRYSKYKTRIKFTVVRNPLARLVSAYYYTSKKPKEFKEAFGEKHLVINPTIKKFDYCINDQIDRIYKGNSNYWQEVAKKDILRHHFGISFWLAPQYHWIMDNDGNFLVDFILKLENIEQESKIFANSFNLNLRKNKKLNSTEHKPWQKHFSKTTKEFFFSLYKKDFDLFNYNSKNIIL